MERYELRRGILPAAIVCLLTACGDDSGGGAAATSASSTSSGTGGSSASSTTSATSSGSGGAGGSEDPCGNGALDADEACDDGDDEDADGCDGACAEETGFDCFGEPSDCVPICGDGLVLGGESCDDGGLDAGDGCGADCAAEAGFACEGEPSLCLEVCGDGLVVGLETCDDGGALPGDGCDALCFLEDGWGCDGEPSACAAICGDALIVGLEGCDDGGVLPGDGCDDLCAIEGGWACAGAPSSCTTSCGDGVVAGVELCDDGALLPGDGCDAACVDEVGWYCSGSPSACATACSDGIPAGQEGCDDGALVPGDGCDAACVAEVGYSCSGAPSVCVTTCGDGLTAGNEACDDGDALPGDGCDAGCQEELGYDCAGTPSQCVTTCGDTVIAGAEVCDDGGQSPGDGCDGNCQEESGYDCTGQPSQCLAVCGDGILLPGEGCDDGNLVDADGCSPSCVAGTGESCADPLGPPQATVIGSQLQWSLGSGAVSTADATWSCDASGPGPDAVLYVHKTSGDVASGGNLLHVFANVPGSTSTANYLNLRVVSGNCANGQEEKCLWYKHDWDTYLDVPAGDYYIFVGKNSAGTFPATTVLAEEVPPSAAEGEGCWGPYTIASSIYTPPAGAGQPHTWIVPATINSFDMGPTWGAPGSIACDDTSPYGDIHGVDAVIAFDKTVSTSVLSVTVQNQDPTLTQSDLDFEVMTTCDPTDPARVTLACGANADTLTGTAGNFTTTHYIWVSTEATGEELNGASVQVTELFPGPGESRYTAIPLLGSGPVSPGSTLRLDPPSCMPAGANVTWYSFVPGNTLVSVQTNALGAFAVLDASGAELRCVTDAFTAPVGTTAIAGQSVYFAVETPTSISALTLTQSAYTGLAGTVTDLGVTFPSSATTDYWLAADATSLYLGGTTKVFAFSKAGGVLATEYGAAAGIATTHLGYSAVVTGVGLLSLDTTTSTSASRLYRIYDAATTTWGPTAWDLTPTYPASSAGHSLATDGTTPYLATYNTSGKVDFYSLGAAAPAQPVSLGTNTSVENVVGLAVDAQYFYVAGAHSSTAVEGVYRISRANVAGAATLLAAVNTSTLHSQVNVDDYAAPENLYVRDSTGDLHVVAFPAAASPLHLGALSSVGTSSDYAMVFDPLADVVFLFETETDSAGKVVMIQ